MTTYYRRSGVTNWSDTTGWSLTSGGASAGVAPTAADDVIFDANSGNCTITGATGTPDLCRSIDCTGYTGTITHNANAFLNIGDASGGSLKFVSGMTYTRLNISNSTIRFNSSATGLSIDTAGKTMANLTFIGTGTYVITGTISCGPFNVTGASNITFGGHVTYNGQSTWSAGTINSNGYNFTGSGQVNFSGATVTVVDISNNNTPITHTLGTVTVTGNVSCNRVLISGTGVKVLNMGSGTWTMTQSGSGGLGWDVNALTTNLTLNAQTSTILFNDTGTNNKTIRGGGYTYYNVQFNGAASNGTWTFLDGNTFNSIILAPLSNIRFTNSTTTTVAVAPTWTGTSGNLITVASDSGSVNATLSYSGGGTVSCDYLNLTRITATGSTPFYAGANSTNGGNNTNWTFTAPPGGSTGQIKAYVSGSFVAKPVKWYNGSTWVVKPLKRWNGSSWVTTPY